MADVSCSIPVSKKHSNASGVSAKHIYDGVFSAPAPRKLNKSAFSFRIDDYSEIFSPSKASLGLSIPTLDLPAVDQSDLTGDCWSSSVDYAGVFGGLGDDNGFAISADELFLKSKRKSKRNSRRSRSSKQTKIKTPIDQEFSCVYGNNQATASPIKTKISPSKSQELCGTSRNNQASTSVSSHQPCVLVKDFNYSHHKTNQSSKDGTDGTTSIARLHTAPLNTHMFDEFGPSRKTGLGKAKFMSMDVADSKDTRAVSDLGLEKQANDHEAGLKKEFDEDRCYTFDASHSTGEANCVSQTYREPTLSSSPRVFSTNDNFRRSSSQGSKNSTNNQRSSEAADSSPLLNQELDENSAAAVSAAAMKRAIEEAEAKIRSAKEFLKGKEINGAGRLSFKDIFNVQATSETIHSYGACGMKQNGSPKVDATVQNQYVDEDNLQQEDDLNSKTTGENNDFNEGGGLKSQNNLNVTAEIEDQFEEMHDSLLQPEFVNGAELEDMTHSVEILKPAEKSHKHEGGGEWEPAKQFSQLLTGVKNRFVSFISKQADTEKTVIQGAEPSSSESVEQSERSTYQVQDVDAHVREADQDHLEKEVEMNGYASSESGESAQDSNRVGTEIHKLEENDVIIIVALEQEKVEEVTVSSDVKMPITEQSDPPESENDLNKVEVQESVEVKRTLIQDDIQDQDQAIVDEFMKRKDDEKSQMENNELEQHDMTQEATYKTRRYDSKEEDCEDNQEADEKGVYESLDGEDGNWRQEEGFISVEETITEELEESVLAAELCTMECSETFEFQDVKGEATAGLVEIADDTSELDDVCEHDESLLLSKNEEACVHAERSKYAQLVEEEVEGRMENLATSPIAYKVSDEQLIIASKVNDEQLIIEPEVNDEQPITEPKVNVAEPIIEPKVNVAEPIIEPKVNEEQLIIEPEVNDEQPSFEPKVNDENPNTEPKVNVEQTICFERANQLDKEDITEQPRHSFEVVADISPEHDNYFPAVDICELDEKSSLNRTEQASGCDDSLQYAHDVGFTCEKEGMGESTNTTSETKGNLEELNFVHTANELLEKEICEPTECSTELANETVDHDEYPPPADGACMTEEHSYLNGKDEDERVTEAPVVTSEPELNVEQPSYVQTATSLIGEDMNETSTAAGDPEDIDVIEEEIEDTHEVLSHTNILKVQQETDLNCEQKLVDEEIFTTDIGLENQVDESVCSTDTEEVDMASDQDNTMYDFETSNKRKRWFEKDEMQDLHQTDILLGDEINQEPDQENAEGSIVDDRVEFDVDETVIESCSGLEDGHSTEPTHRRRRWFQYRGEEAMHKPIVIDVVEMTTEMDDEIVQESELDDSFRDCVDNVTKKKKETADVQENYVASDQVESTANDGAAPRRRKWFENGEKSGPAQRPSILVDNVIDADPEEIEIEADAAIHDDQLNDREAQKEKERIVVERAIREARKRAFTEVRKKAAAAAQDKQGKASSEPKTGSDRASMDAKLRVERAAVERATAEARERALQKAVSAKAAYESREKDPKNQTSGPSGSKGCTSGPIASEISSGATSESPQRGKAVSERNRRTMERATKALEEKNMRDSFAQKEQAERDRFADALDGEVKRWLIGKEGNLRSLLSTLQYILGPDSGWQPIPLVDLIDPTAVRKAYKRAALCVHPDKLQQRGATVQQKYICEKVFDLLKDAWQWHEICPDDL